MAYDRTLTARRILLAKATSALALATGLAIGSTGPARAQAFEGTPTVVSGGVNINRTPGTDNIRVDTNQAVINWTTNDTAVTGGPINFLPSGRTAIYRNNPTAQNQFTVLNRIIPTGTSRLVQFNGTVISQLQTAAGLVSGGNVWFYSPGGIVVNSTAVIDVGGLLLTSSDPVRDAAGDFITGGGSFTLGAASPTSSVIVQPGAQIRATPENSYVAMVAPAVLQGGNVSVNGSALYVGAEAATITFGGNGLFDIQVTTGTNGSSGVAIGHSGVTTGPASTGAGDNHRIYMVAVPKNNAITLALSGGSLGFDVAGAANAVGNSIILSSGYNVFGDTIDDSAPVNPAQQARLFISDSTITSSLAGAGVTEAVADAFNADLSFASNLSLRSPANARITARNGRTVTIAGNAQVSADAFATTAGQDVTAGTAQIRAFDNGIINIGGSVRVSADGFGGNNFVSGSVGSGTGGTTLLQTDTGGQMTIGGSVDLSASGFAGVGEPNTGVGSNFGRGGLVVLSNVGSNSRMTINGNLNAVANGSGSVDYGSGTAGNGFGGEVSIAAGNSTAAGTGNSLTIFGTATLNADGFGGESAFGRGGNGTGGTASFGAGIGGTAGVLGNLLVTGIGLGGLTTSATGRGGDGIGGRAFAQVFGAGGIVNAGANVTLQGLANGGIARTPGGNGGNGTGGQAQMVINAAGGSLNVTGVSDISAFGSGGQGTIGGNGTGGTALVSTNTSGVITLSNNLFISAGGVSGAATTAGQGGSGNGLGGTAQIVALANGAINITGNVDIDANGGTFGSSLTGVDGGNGTGGRASISQNTGGLISITGNASVAANGFGGDNSGGGDGIAGNGVGGDARIAVNDRSITITGNATTDARGFGGNSVGGIRGGNGTGGLANLGAGAGTLSIGGNGTTSADGLGGSSIGAGSGGIGTGGRAVIGSIVGGIIQIAGEAELTAQGFGGNASGAGNFGGFGDGGETQLFADNNGSVTVGGVTTFNASAFGGSTANGADTGAALGGTASLLSLGNGQIALNQDTFMSSQALSGNADSDGGNVGIATGGDTSISASGAGSRIRITGNLFADAIAGAGSSTTGLIGAATGGTTRIDSASGIVNITGSATLDSSAFGGDSVTTGNGGNATGGRTAVVVGGAGGASINIGSALTMTSNAFGGSAQTGNGGNATGGLTEGGTIGVIASFAFGGNVTMAADGTGGSSLLAGAGGSGTGGTARMGSNGAQMIGRDIFIQANGRGGNGAAGGAGGNATGGLASLFAGSGAVTGLLDFDNASLAATAFGGAGGTGTTGATGGNGGAGGNATGGRVIATSAAGNGQLDLLNLQVTSNGFAGAGGAGGVGTAGRGGAGGAGGRGTGGSNQFGSESGGGALTVNVGTTRLVNAVSETNGFGGAGGAGGTGTTGSGNGGAGGVGQGGDNVLLVRGSLVAMNNATLISNGQGGNGGAGAVLGAGGDGIGGGIAFAITDRFQIPANRGRLQANDLLGVARGLAGTGSTRGQTFYGTGSNVEVRNADATVNSLVINTSGNAPDPVGIVEDFIRITDGQLSVSNSFTYITPGQLSVLVNNGSVNAGAFGVRAGTFVPDTVVTAPANVGTITAGAVDLQSAGNILVTANFSTPGGFTALGAGAVTLRNINAGGVIGIQGASQQLGNLTSGNHINLTTTTGAIVAGTVTAANFIAMTAANGLTLSLATATNGYVDLLVNAGNMTIGNVTAGGYIALETVAGNITVGNLTSGQETDIEAIGNASFGNVDAGLNLSVLAAGSITGGNIVTRGVFTGEFFGTGLVSSGAIQIGSVQSAGNIGALTTSTFTSGALSTGSSILLLVDGNILVNGGATAGTAADRFFFVGNSSMQSLFGGGGNRDAGGNVSFVGGDPAPIFAATPVRTVGSLTVAGPVSAGNVRAGVGTGATFGGTMTAATGSIVLTANSLAAQAMNAALGVNLTTTAGALGSGAINSSAGNIVLTSAGTVATGALTTGTGANLAVTVDGQGAVSIGGVTATGAAQLRSRTASFTSTGSITAASVSISGTAATLANVTSTSAGITIGATGGNLAFGALNSATNTQFNVTGSVNGGDITAGTSIGTIVTGNMVLGNLRTTAAGTTSTGFSIGLGAGGTITTGTINSFGLLGIGSDDGQGNFGNATSITTGAITAGGTVLARASQGIVTGAISSTNEIRVRGGSVTTGNLNATNAVFVAALNGNLNTGNVTTGTNALLLASQSISTGTIGTGTSGTTLLASSAGLAPTANLSQIDLNTLLAATPARVGGSVSIGATTTGTLLGASTGTFSANSTITAGTRISLDVGGTAVFGGLAVAPTIAISSGDIAFSQAGGLGNANTGTITLTANRSGSVVIGGATSDSQSQQSGYTLDGSEISRIRAQSIVINAPNVSSTGTGVEIRALTMNGSTAASGVNLNGSEGSLTINTPGTIRVNGNAVFNAMASTNRVSLNANRVEINADTGGLFLNGSSPGGILSINANNIHIASASLLERLAENVNFTGRDTALGLPIATARPDGVIQASSLRFTVGSTLLIQNTGTSLLNAGFFGRVGSFQVTPRSSQSQGTPSLIDLVIYGQLLDTGDLVRNGTSVRDLIFPRSTSAVPQDSSISGFTSNSAVNGCLLTAISCGGGGITETGPTAVVHAGPPPPQPAAEREQKQEQEEAEAAAEEAARGEAAPRRPIMPPVTIVNTRRLGVEPIIDEPVTSGGNPNLQLDVPLNEAVPETGGQP